MPRNQNGSFSPVRASLGNVPKYETRRLFSRAPIRPKPPSPSLCLGPLLLNAPRRHLCHLATTFCRQAPPSPCLFSLQPLAPVPTAQCRFRGHVRDVWPPAYWLCLSGTNVHIQCSEYSLLLGLEMPVPNCVRHLACDGSIAPLPCSTSRTKPNKSQSSTERTDVRVSSRSRKRPTSR